uniref:flagellar filament capping protein FliD n=1 Tax=Acetatifactor sp. TaxID=1872090 RepID=UPI004055E6D4
MAMRMTGLMSGMDTESIIQDLVAVRRTKVDTAVKAQTKLEWKQEAWKDLNSKLKNLQTKYINNMRFTTAFAKKTSKVSNSSIVSVITGENAVNGVQSLAVRQLAKTGYLTGAKVETEDGAAARATSKLSALGIDFGEGGEGTFTVKTGKKSVDIKVTNDTTISDVLNEIKGVGLNASFDAKNQRFFISAQESGKASDFSITAKNANGNSALAALGLQTDLSKVNPDDRNTWTADYQEYNTWASYYVAGDRDATLDNMSSMITSAVDSRVKTYLQKYENLLAVKEKAQEKINKLAEKYEVDSGAVLDKINQTITDLEAQIETEADEDAKKKLEEELATAKADRTTLETQNANVVKCDEEIVTIAGTEDAPGLLTITETEGEDGKISYSAVATDELLGDVQQEHYDKATQAASVIEAHKTAYDNGTLQASGATKVSGQDAIILLNDAEFTNSTNSFEINGLTITAQSETKEGEVVTITTQNDTDGVYDLVKNFLKEYNAVINEMDKLYNADAAKGYEPLTDDEKYEMSEKQIEEWEEKIKESLLRRDSNLSSVSSALKDIMSSGISVNGKTMYLSDFGINTLGYFNAADNEKNAYHIDGDPDDADTSGKADKLKGMIASDPDTVISFFTQLSQNLYSKMTSLSASVDGYRSFGSFYDDKKMKTDYADYTSKIADLEKKLTDYEDKWYAKFSAMETAMAKMQSNSNAVTSLLGG